MDYKGVHYCDYCFEKIAPGAQCPVCHLTPEKYKTEPGLLMPGEVLAGKYIIGRTIGRGGFGATYLAYELNNARKVAIKEYYPIGIAHRNEGERKITVLSSDKENLFQKGANRFYEEAKTIATFNDAPNVATVYELFYENNTAYYAMEYLQGVDLKSYTKKCGGRISEGEALTIMEQMCNALTVIHSTGTIHRDISPDNIFICSGNIAKLIDFGAAKQFVGEESQSLSVILKRGFAPIEQYQKNGKHGMWTDIYALGSTIYFALTGKIPDDAMTRIEKQQKDIDSADALGISQQFRDILNKCMKIDLKDRFKSTYEVMQELKKVQIPRIALKSFTTEVSQNTQNYNSQIFTNSQFSQQFTTSQQIPYSQQLPPSQFVPPSQIIQPNNDDREHKKTVGIIAGIAAAVVAVIILLVAVVFATKPKPPMDGMPPGPPPGQMQQMPPGQQ